MKLVSGSLLVALVSTAAVAAAPNPPAPAAAAPAQPAAVPAAAPSAERLDLARKFVNASMSTDRYMDYVHMGATQAASEAIVNNADASDTPPEKVMADVDKVVAQMEPAMRAQLPKLFEAFAQAYAREFTADELRAMTAFAATPAGRHYLGNREFVLSDEGVMKAQMDLMESVAPILEGLQKQACARRTAERIAMGDKKATCPLAKAAETQQG
jgi:hypothetical protein